MRILIVDDNEVFRVCLARIIEAAGALAICAASGAEALALFEEAHPDVVFTDINMPGMDGFDLLAALRAGEAPLPPVIAVTSQWCEGALSVYVAAGFDWAIEKPLKPAAILNVLAALRSQRAATAA